MNRTYTDNPEHDYGPTRTQQRRDALAVLALAMQLVELPPSKLARANLPEDVLREVENTRRITAHIARKRQLGFLAKVMRRHEDDAYDGLRTLLGENRDQLRKEGEKIEVDWGVVGCLYTLEPEEVPMAPITMLRNALGVAEGGSGVALDRAAYQRSVEFWERNANWRDLAAGSKP